MTDDEAENDDPVEVETKVDSVDGEDESSGDVETVQELLSSMSPEQRAAVLDELKQTDRADLVFWDGMLELQTLLEDLDDDEIRTYLNSFMKAHVRRLGWGNDGRPAGMFGDGSDIVEDAMETLTATEQRSEWPQVTDAASTAMRKFVYLLVDNMSYADVPDDEPGAPRIARGVFAGYLDFLKDLDREDEKRPIVDYDVDEIAQFKKIGIRCAIALEEAINETAGQMVQSNLTIMASRLDRIEKKLDELADRTEAQRQAGDS